MRSLNETELQEINDTFPALSSFGIGAIWLYDDNMAQIVLNYEIPKGIGLDDDVENLHKFIEKKYKVKLL